VSSNWGGGSGRRREKKEEVPLPSIRTEIGERERRKKRWFGAAQPRITAAMLPSDAILILRQRKEKRGKKGGKGSD